MEIRNWHGGLATITAVLLVLILTTPPMSAQSPPRKLTIAAAADLQYVMNELEQEFERHTGAEVTIVYGASGNLFTQIQNGAPFDVFMSADMDYPRRLVSARLADPDSLYRYAVGRLVLWTGAGSHLDVAKLGMNALLDPAVQKIAIANPRTAPYGRAAVEALRYYKLYDRVSGKLIVGESARQTEQFAESGNAQLALLPLSFAFPPEQKHKGAYIEVPIKSYSAIDQGVVVVARSQNKALAGQFLAFLKRHDTVLLLRRYGFVEAKSLGR